MNQNRLILREFKAIADKPDSGWTAELYYPNDLQKWKIYLDGPSGTPYENGKFQLFVIFPEAYPFKPPEFRFNTRIFHPNIGFDGHLSIDILNQSETYSPKVSIRSVLGEIVSLLRSPDPEFPLCPEAAFLFSKDQQFFYDKAASWTATYATNDDIISSGSTSPKSLQNVCNDSYKRKLEFVLFNFSFRLFHQQRVIWI
jgi:ubiquitin-protein ligase